MVWQQLRTTQCFGAQLKDSLLEFEYHTSCPRYELQPRTHIHVHRFCVGISRQPSFSQLPPDPTLFDSSKRDSEIGVVAAVDPYHARLDIPRDTMRLGDVLCEDGAPKSIRGIVRLFDRLLFSLEAGHDHKWPKHFLTIDLHTILHPREHRRLNEESFPANIFIRCPTHCQRRPFTLPRLDIPQHPLKLRLRDLRALKRLCLKRIPNLTSLPNRLLKHLHEPIITPLLHQHPTRRRTDLSLVAHDPDMRPLGRLLHIRIVKHQQRTLPARLQRDILQIHRRGLHDLSARRGTPRERNLVDALMTRNRIPRHLPVSIQQIHHPRWEPGFLDQCAEIKDTERGLLGGFQHHAIPARERGAEFPGRHGERVVPGDDLAADAEGFAEGVGEFCGTGVDDGAVEFVGIAGVVAEAGGDFGKVFGGGDGVGFAVVPGFDGGEGGAVFVDFINWRASVRFGVIMVSWEMVGERCLKG